MIVLVVGFSAAADAGSPLPPQELSIAREGLIELYHGRVDSAAFHFERLRRAMPESPAADFLHGGIHWHELTTGPQGFTQGGATEQRFFERMDAAIELGEQALEKNRDDLPARFFTGGAYGYKARYLALQEKWWDAYRSGKKGVRHLEYVVEKDPDFKDAYLGLGIYHYYTDVLPSVLQFFGGLVGMHGDKARGLREIRTAFLEGDLVNEESRFFLAEIYTTFEENHFEALSYASSLVTQYPDNELFSWILARVLDELHETDGAKALWKDLREKPRGRRLRGFLDYRLARSDLFAGDFKGAAAQLERHLKMGRLGSRRITMWGRLRHGLALDVLGRHDAALQEYRLAHDLDASDSAKKRTSERLRSAKRGADVTSLLEVEEMARILRETASNDTVLLDHVENLLVEPSRGLSSAEKTQYFGILHSLAETRLRAGSPSECIQAIERTLDRERRIPQDSRAQLLLLEARAHARASDPDAVRDTLRRARSKASYAWRRILEQAEPALLRASEGGTPNPLPVGDVEITLRDRGETSLEFEAHSDPGKLLPFRRLPGKWVFSIPVPTDTLLYRFVADANVRRVDPSNTGTIWIDGEAWSVWVRQPKQTNSSISR